MDETSRIQSNLGICCGKIYDRWGMVVLSVWLPAYLKDQYHLELTEMAIPLAVLYSMTMVVVCGGWFRIY